MRKMKSEMKSFRIGNVLCLVERIKDDINGNKRYKVHVVSVTDKYLGTWSVQAYSEEEAANDVYCSLQD